MQFEIDHKILNLLKDKAEHQGLELQQLLENFAREGTAVRVGDLVVPVDDDKYQLASGCSRYNHAVVVSIEPFVLVSPKADMKWSCTVRLEQFKYFGRACATTLAKCMKRL